MTAEYAEYADIGRVGRLKTNSIYQQILFIQIFWNIHKIVVKHQ